MDLLKKKKSVTGKLVIECQHTFLAGTITESAITRKKSTNSQSNSKSWKNAIGLDVTAEASALPSVGTVGGGVDIQTEWGGSTNNAIEHSDDDLNSKQDTHTSPEKYGFHIRTITKKFLFDVTKYHLGYDVENTEKTYLSVEEIEAGRAHNFEEDALKYMQIKYDDNTLKVPCIEFIIAPTKYEEWETLQKRFPNESKWYLRTYEQKTWYCFVDLDEPEDLIRVRSKKGPPSDSQLFEINWEGEGADSYVYLTSETGRKVYMSNNWNGDCKAHDGLPKKGKAKWIIERVPSEQDVYHLMPLRLKDRAWAYIDPKDNIMKKSNDVPSTRGWFDFVKSADLVDDATGEPVAAATSPQTTTTTTTPS